MSYHKLAGLRMPNFMRNLGRSISNRVERLGDKFPILGEENFAKGLVAGGVGGAVAAGAPLAMSANNNRDLATHYQNEFIDELNEHMDLRSQVDRNQRARDINSSSHSALHNAILNNEQVSLRDWWDQLTPQQRRYIIQSAVNGPVKY